MKKVCKKSLIFSRLPRSASLVTLLDHISFNNDVTSDFFILRFRTKPSKRRYLESSLIVNQHKHSAAHDKTINVKLALKIERENL